MSLGRELLHLQGIQLGPEVRDRLSESQMSDLAGNACLDFRLVKIYIVSVSSAQGNEYGLVLS